MISGRRRFAALVTLPAKSFQNRADAQRWIRQTELELDRLALAYDPSRLERITVADLLARYRDEVTSLKRGVADEAKRIEVFLREKWAGLTLARISPLAFSQHRDDRLRQVKAGTVIRELGLLRAVFEVARREWDMPPHENPLAKALKPRAATGHERRLQPDELSALLVACTVGRSDWLEVDILFAIESGMRRGEILNVRTRDIDFERGLLHVPETKTDTHYSANRHCKAAPATKGGWLHRNGWQVVHDDSERVPVGWERCKRRAAKEIPGLADLRFHDPRHEAVSRFSELGLNVPEVGAKIRRMQEGAPS